MNRFHGARREIERLRRKLSEEDRAFKAGAPALDQDGLPMWDGTPGLPVESYTKALDGDVPDEDLNEDELATRNRLSPYREIFEQLDEKARGGEDVT